MTTDGCLQRSGSKTAGDSSKEAGITVYLMEELTDARLRCEELVRYIADATKLIEKSSHRDHFFEVAGHLIQGMPEAAFKLQKALQAVSLAATRMDYEELKQELRPEKVEQLENVLKDVRIRRVQRQSDPVKPWEQNMIDDWKTPEARNAKTEEKESRFEEGKPADPTENMSPEDAKTWKEEHAKNKDNFKAAAVKTKADFDKLQSEMRAHLDTFDMSWSRYEKDPEKNKAKLDDALRYMKSLRELADTLIRNMEGLKGKTASAETKSAAFTFRLDPMHVPLVGQVGAKLKWDGNQMAAFAVAVLQDANLHSEAKAVDTLLTRKLASDPTACDDDKRSRFEEGKPADPTENMSPGDAKTWKEEHAKHKDNFKAAGNDEKESRFEEGKPADPTENMSPEDAKTWKLEHLKNKDNFKEAASFWKADNAQ